MSLTVQYVRHLSTTAKLWRQVILVRRVNDNYAATPQMDLQFALWKDQRKLIVSSECFYIWTDSYPNGEEMAFHVLLKVMEEEGIGWYYEQGYLTLDGNYFRLGITHF